MTITLVDNLDNRAPNALHLEYTINGAVPRPTWSLAFVGALPQNVSHFTNAAPAPVAAVAAVAPQVPAAVGANPLTMPNVQSRTLVAHYATAPNVVRHQVSSVQP